MSDNPTGHVASAVKVVGDVAISLPPVYLALLVVNCIFIGSVFWFLNVQTESRTRLVERLINVCVAPQKPIRS